MLAGSRANFYSFSRVTVRPLLSAVVAVPQDNGNKQVLEYIEIHICQVFTGILASVCWGQKDGGRGCYVNLIFSVDVL